MRKRFILYILLLFTSTVFAQHYSPYAAWEQPEVEEIQAHQDTFIVVVNPNIYTWLSVDPLSDKYPNISSYAYCAWNPLKYFDEHGLEKKNFFNAEVNNP